MAYDVRKAFEEDMKKAKQSQNKETNHFGIKSANQAFFNLGGMSEQTVEEQSYLNVKSLPLDVLVERDINNFRNTDVTSLAESIRECGLINPISVVHDSDKDTYTVSAGHRRLKAMKLLHEQDPDNEYFQTIDCNIYEVTDNEKFLVRGFPYISRKQEEQIYVDSNLENRQLNYNDVAKQIRTILKRFDDPVYVERISNMYNHEKKIYENFNRPSLIIQILKTQQYEGWKERTIRNYIEIYDSKREDLLDGIEQGKLKVNGAYEKLKSKTEENSSYKKKTEKFNSITKAITSYRKDKIRSHNITESDIEDLKNLKKKINELIDEFENLKD